jgi:hypothetical protein
VYATYSTAARVAWVQRAQPGANHGVYPSRSGLQ